MSRTFFCPFVVKRKKPSWNNLYVQNMRTCVLCARSLCASNVHNSNCCLTITTHTQAFDVSVSSFNELNEETLTSTDVWEYFVGYLLHTYRIEKGKRKGEHLNVNNVRNYLQTMLRLSKESLITSKRKETILFFQCLDSKSLHPMAQWMRGAFLFVVRVCPLCHVS